MQFSPVRRLPGLIDGEVVFPYDAQWPQARALFNRRVERRPLAIVFANSRTDVVRTMSYARSQDLRVVVRSGRHSPYGLSLADDSLVLDVSRLRGIHVAAGQDHAWIEAGVTIGELESETALWQRAAVLGACPTVSVTGLSLAGGYGVLARRFGLACDNVVAARLVTPEGELLECSADANADILWALRGGGTGYFGAVTDLCVRLHRVPQSCLQGGMVFRGAAIVEAFLAVQDVMTAAPDTFNMRLLLNRDPHGGEVTLTVAPLFLGDTDEGMDLLGPVLACGPASTQLGGDTYAQCQEHAFASFEWLVDGAAWWRTGYRSTPLTESQLRRIVRGLAEAPGPYSRMNVEFGGGAIDATAATATAFPHRQQFMNVILVGAWGSDPIEADAARSWADEAAAVALPARPGIYAGYLDPNVPDWPAAHYGENAQALRRLKTRLDPDGRLPGLGSPDRC